MNEDDSVAVDVSCGDCGRDFRVSDTSHGKRVRCSCGVGVRVPLDDDDLDLETRPKRQIPANKKTPGHKSAIEVRLRGLMMIVAGFVLTPITVLLSYGIIIVVSSVLGAFPTFLMVLGAAPLVLSFVGWFELLIGIEFTRISKAYDSAGFINKVGLSIVVIIACIVFFVLMVVAFGLTRSALNF